MPQFICPNFRFNAPIWGNPVNILWTTIASLAPPQPHTGKILAAFVSGLADRNAAVRKTYAAAIGHLMRTAKDRLAGKTVTPAQSFKS